MSTKLIRSILNGNKILSDLTEGELWSIYNTSVANDDPRFFKFVTNSFTGIYDYNVKKPYWLLSDFSAPIWYIEVKDNGNIFKRVINWSVVTLSDNLSLTDKSHTPLLNAFKYWITATDNPRENAGRFKKGSYVNSSIVSIILLINSILIHGKSIRLAELHLGGMSDDFFMSLMIRLCENGAHTGLYDFTNQTREYLLGNISTITELESRLFTKAYPNLTRILSPDESPLGLSIAERVKACCFLSKKGYYDRLISGENSNYISKYLRGRKSVLLDLVFENKIIPIDSCKFDFFDELVLIDSQNFSTEFKSIPCVEVSDVMSETTIRTNLMRLKLLTTVNKMDNTAQLPKSALKSVTLSRIREHVNIKIKGRYKSVPSPIVFYLITRCYEFTCKYEDSILDSVFSILIEGRKKSSIKHSNQNRSEQYGTTEKVAWLRTDALDLVDDKLRNLGVDKIFMFSTDDDYFIKLRNNKSLFSLYSVLIGSIQVLTGVIMAKRIDELISLKSHGNLYPNIDPSSEKGEKIEFELISELKKSGSGGEYGRNAKIKRPIPRSFALKIWKLEQFNKSVLKFGLNKSELTLFNSLSSRTLLLSKCYPSTYNRNLNIVCDYFETPLVTFQGEEVRRYYIRQHQLRRFFAMVFFWSKSFDGLDTLSWMLGHTDMKHLYHYITESITGEVLNGVKASYIIDSIEKKNLDNIQALADLIAERYGVNSVNISLSTVSNAVEDYKDTNDYQTFPHIDQLAIQGKLESQIIELLEEGVISLEPEFFTVEQDGKQINSFTLSLQVNELD